MTTPDHDPATQDPRQTRGVVLRIIFWVLVVTLYMLGLVALLLRTQPGLIPGYTAVPATPASAPAPGRTFEATITMPAQTSVPTATLVPTRTPRATLYPTLTPRP